MAEKEILCAYGVDFDAVAGWLGSYGGENSPLDFMKTVPNSQGFESPRVVEETWRDAFDWVYRKHDYAIFPMTIHPDVSGRPQVLAMHERLFEHMSSKPGVRFVTMREIADDFRRRQPRA